MRPKPGVVIIAFIETLIGTITLFAVVLSLIQGESTKPPGVLVFVLSASVLSVILGLGILRLNLACYHLLLYFSSVIILSKILILAGVITLNGALETTIPSTFKNAISITYHALLIFYFTRQPIQAQFGERRNVIPSLKKLFGSKHGS